MKGKRLLSMLLSFLLVLAGLPTINVGVKAADETVYYVSADGADENIGTMSEPLNTISEAVSKLGDDSDGIIKIIGEYQLGNADVSVAHSKNIIIEGADSSSSLVISGHVRFSSGPYTIRNIIMNYSASTRTVYASGNDVTYGEGLTVTGTGAGWWTFQNMACTSGSGATTYTNKHKFTINSGDLYRLYVGDSEIATGQKSTIPGLDFTMNGGHIYQFILGGNGWDGMWGTNSYTDNVNLTFNGGSVDNGIVLAKYGVKNTYFQGGTEFNGNALQIIMNNGVDIPLDSGTTQENVNACNGKLYVLKCAANKGSSLETTDIAGQYKVIGNRVAIASDGENEYKSENGVLTVPYEGTYTVTWEPISTYYVSASGSDDNDGSEESPFGTISKAVTELNANEGNNNTVKIIGEYQLENADVSVAHDKNVIIEGAESSSALVIAGNVTFSSGPYTIKNIIMHYSANSCAVYASGNDITYGEGITVTGHSAGWWTFQNMASTSGTGATTYTNKHRFTINSGDLYRLYVGNGRIATGQKSTIPGLDFTMNGGHTYQFILGGDGWDGMWGTNSYTDNVNLTFNGGSVDNGIILAKYGVKETYFQGGTEFNGNALQIIMNNGVNIPLDQGTTQENVNACNGKLYVLKCAANEGSSLEATDTAGKYKVNGDITAVATDGTKVYRSENGYLNVPEGTYSVTWSDVTVKVDGEYAVVEDGKITLGDAEYGYYCAGKMYKANSQVEVTGTMSFTSVKELSVAMADGAGIRYIGDTGLRFQSTITSDNMDAVASDAIKEGTLITTKAIFDEDNEELTLDYSHAMLNVVNSGWFGNQTGTYCGSICKIADTNYAREFTARAYVTVNYEDGTSVTVYSGMGPSRSVKFVAQAIIDDNYAGIDSEYHSVIDNFAK